MNTLFFEIFKYFNQMEKDILVDISKKLQRIQLVNEEINKDKLHSNSIKNKSNNKNKTKKSTKDILISVEKLESIRDKINLKLSDKQEYDDHLDKLNIQFPIKKENEGNEENNFNNQVSWFIYSTFVLFIKQ
ncbi:hypothetical protein K502DRAFT_137299 [Neoconidiobolus thromboides FSU 785]|nr:hypothetical protein K502DRAFT_137299 [Neoconidiobolus thromboides FSU 785]